MSSSQITDLLGEGTQRSDIISRLLAEGHDERAASEMVNKAMRKKASKARFQALVLISAGAIACGGSCVLTITSNYTHSAVPILLYSITTAGIVAAISGFSRLF